VLSRSSHWNFEILKYRLFIALEKQAGFLGVQESGKVGAFPISEFGVSISTERFFIERPATDLLWSCCVASSVRGAAFPAVYEMRLVKRPAHDSRNAHQGSIPATEPELTELFQK